MEQASQPSPAPEQNPTPAPSASSSTSLPAVPKPEGPILSLSAIPNQVWFPPERLRGPEQLSAWIGGMSEVAAIDCMLIRLAADTTILTGKHFHVQIPSNTPRYLPYRWDSSPSLPEGTSVKLAAGTNILLQESVKVARIISLKPEESDKKSSLFAELRDARVAASYLTDPPPGAPPSAKAAT